jgi:hypothetical protein
LRSSRFDAAQSSRFATVSIAQRNGQSWISHNRQKRGRLSSVATGRVRAIYGHSPTPLGGHLNVGFTAESGSWLDGGIRRVIGHCSRWPINN